ncbi:MAG: serine/threonine protein kinase, partial [Planctomycetales bacterium]|nr:serine/threonine protein kinase [Planctomycetales bacterium]
LLYMQHVSGGTLLDAMRSVHAQPRGSWTGQALMDVVDLTLIEQGIDPPLGVEQRRRLGTMDWPSTVCLLGSQLASALDYSHQQGVLHRDLKPANILLNEGVLPKLVDFNVSSCSKLDGASPSSYFGGSLAYMSPEQLEACNPCHDRDPESLDGRSDVYALAVVLWEMLTGRRPFHDTQQPGGWPATVALMTAKRQDGLTDAHYEMLPANCPRSLRDILTRCLAPQPDERFRRAEDLAVQLRRSLNPNTQRLLSPPKRGWRGLVARFPALSTVVALLLPHTLAGIFNYEYNYHVIIDRYVEGHSEIETTFFLLSTIINAIAFPLGVIIGLRLIWTSTRAVRRRALSHEDSPANPAVRHRCLSLGHRLAVLGLALWLVAGVAYPICLSAAGAQLDAADYVHFFASLVVCGLIVGAYPFFGAFAMVVESWYPLLIGNGAVEREDLPVFQKLQKLSWYYLVTAVLVPMISVAILLTIQSIDPDVVVMLRFVSIMGIVLFIVVFALARRVQQDLAILEAEAASDEGH